MGGKPARSADDPSVGSVLAALDDADCRTILRATTEPMTANELIDACDIPRSTLYRKLERLSTASLVRELDEVHPDRGRITRYERDFEDVTISIENGDELSIAIERPARRADERLATIWSKMRDEL